MPLAAALRRQRRWSTSLVVCPLAGESAGAADRAAAAAAGAAGGGARLAAARALVAGKARADEELDAFYHKVLPADLTRGAPHDLRELPALAQKRTCATRRGRSRSIRR